MHTRKVRRYFILPVLYVAVIFGLLFLQFSGTLTVRESIGDLRFTGTLMSGEDETSDQITAARIEYRGLIIEIGDGSPFVVTTDSGSDRELVPQRFEIDERELRVFLSDESYVRFEVMASDPSELHILPVGTQDWPRDGRMLLPYRLDARATAFPPEQSTPESRIVAVEEREFFFSTPPRSMFDDRLGQIVVPISTGSQLIRYAERITEQVDVVATAFGEGQRQISDGFYQDAIDTFIETSYRGWAQSRFNGGSGTWRMRDGASRFSEEILTAYLAEAWSRNEYIPAFNQMRRAADLHPTEVGLLSAPFLGNLRRITDLFVAQDIERAEELEARVFAGDPTVFREQDLIPFSALRGNEELYQAVLSLAQTVDFRTVDMPTAIGMLAAASDVIHPSPAATEATERFLAIIDERILPSVRQFEEFFFVETAQAEVDLYWSIRAGDLLEQVGRESGRELLMTVGRNLVLSGLQLADSQGFLPEFLYFGEAGLQNQEGSFGPERLYAHFAENPWYPRMIPLYEELGAGSFIWTIADFLQVDIGTPETRFRLAYPRNQTHYVLMHGIPPFSSMQLFGLIWRNDPNFEAYIKGRHYEQRTDTLMIKYTDDSTQQDIILFYQ